MRHGIARRRGELVARGLSKRAQTSSHHETDLPMRCWISVCTQMGQHSLQFHPPKPQQRLRAPEEQTSGAFERRTEHPQRLRQMGGHLQLVHWKACSGGIRSTVCRAELGVGRSLGLDLGTRNRGHNKEDHIDGNLRKMSDWQLYDINMTDDGGERTD